MSRAGRPPREQRRGILEEPSEIRILVEFAAGSPLSQEGPAAPAECRDQLRHSRASLVPAARCRSLPSGASGFAEPHEISGAGLRCQGDQGERRLTWTGEHRSLVGRKRRRPHRRACHRGRPRDRAQECVRKHRRSPYWPAVHARRGLRRLPFCSLHLSPQTSRDRITSSTAASSRPHRGTGPAAGTSMFGAAVKRCSSTQAHVRPGVDWRCASSRLLSGSHLMLCPTHQIPDRLLACSCQLFANIGVVVLMMSFVR